MFRIENHYYIAYDKRVYWFKYLLADKLIARRGSSETFIEQQNYAE